MRSLVLATFVMFAAIGCVNGAHGSGSYDSTARQEIHACPMPRTRQPVAPPPGEYVNHGIRIDYPRLVPRQDPAKADQGYILYAYKNPEMLEQLYHDATQGNDLAAWAICAAEVHARHAGRIAARELASLSCQTVLNCNYEVEDLPFSPDTAIP